MSNRIKKVLALVLAMLTLTTCLVVSASALTIGTSYSEAFETTYSVAMDTHNYGYKDIKMRADKLWSDSGVQYFSLALYTKSGSTYVSQGSCACDTGTSGGTYIWYNANTNAVLPKPAYFVATKKSANGVEIGGTIVSWSQE